MSLVKPDPIGMERVSAFVKTRSMTSQPSGLPSCVQSLGSETARNAASIAASVDASSAAATCWNGVAGSRPARFR